MFWIAPVAAPFLVHMERLRVVGSKAGFEMGVVKMTRPKWCKVQWLNSGGK